MGIELVFFLIYILIFLFVLSRIRKAGFHLSKLVGRPNNFGGPLFGALFLITLLGPNRVFYFFIQAHGDMSNAPLFVESLWRSLHSIILGPIVEEFVFRFWLFRLFFARMSPVAAILLTSIIFGALHVDAPFLCTLSGIFYSVVFIRTQSLLIPMALHSASNLSGNLLTSSDQGYLIKTFEGAVSEANRELFLSLFLLGNAVIWLGGIILFCWFSKQYVNRTKIDDLFNRLKPKRISV